jgi:2-iminobutanoate/2-iminopropanoate deaminase
LNNNSIKGFLRGMHAINTDKAPKAIGPYSQAVICNGILYVSGQLPINPKTNEIDARDIKNQTRQIMSNINSILSECDLSFNNIIKTTNYLTDLSHFSEVNKEYGCYLNEPFPARVTVGVSNLPKDSLIEIEVTAGIKGE